MPIVNYDWDEDEDNIVEEYDDTGSTIAEYTTEPNQFGDVISQCRSGQESFYHTDGQGSTLALTDANGDATDTFAYSAFGEVTAQTSSTVNPFQYIGQKQYYRDAETGDYEVRIRPLDPGIARWRSADRFDYLDIINAYLYSSNRATFTDDPSGMIPSVSDISWSTTYQQINESINEIIDSEVQRSMANVNSSLDKALAFAALATFNTKCFELTITLQSASITAIGTTVPVGLPWRKRATCSVIALTLQSIVNQLVIPRIKKQFPNTRRTQCPVGQMCDNKWTQFPLLVPVLPIPLGTQLFPLAIKTANGPIPFPIITEACNVALSLAIAVTPTALIANCIKCQPTNAGIRPIDPIFMP